MGQEIVDLYMTLRLMSAPFVAGAGEVTAAGDAMAASVGGAAAKVTADQERMAAATATAGAEITAVEDKLVSSNARMAASIGSASKEWQTSYAAMAATTSELSMEMTMAEAKAAASTEAMAAKIDAAAASTTATTAGAMAKVKQIAIGAGVVAGVTAAVTVKMAGDFEQSTNRLKTSAGETEEGLKVVRNGILDLASEVGVSAEDMSTAMYKIESASYHGGAGLGVLKAAEQGAKAEGADGAKVADALSSALRDYYPHASSAADVTRAATDTMSKFIGATSAGKMTFDELAGSLNSILPVASAAKISMSDVLGVLASMTVHGISAQQATQNMADAIRHLQAPTQVMSKAMATLGIDSTDVAAKLGDRGLSGTMEYLSHAVKKAMPPGTEKVILDLGNALSKSTPQVKALGNALMSGEISMAQYSKSAKGLDPISAGQAASFATLAKSYHQLGTEQLSGEQVMMTYGGMMQKVMGDATGLKVALMTTGENAQYTVDAIKTIGGSAADAGGNVKGWADVQGTFNQKMAEAKDGVNALAIRIGTYLLPVVSKIGEGIAGVTGWLSRNEGAAKAVAVVIGGVLVAAIGALVIATVNWAIAIQATPLGWFMDAVAAITALAAVIVANWDGIAGFFSGLWNKVTGFFKAAADVIGNVVGSIVDFVKNLPSRIGQALSSFGSFLGRIATDAWHAFLHALEVGGLAVLDFFKNLPYRIGQALGFLIGLLARLAVEAGKAFLNAVVTAFRAVVDFFANLPANIARFFMNAINWLATSGSDIVHGLWDGITSGAVAVWHWFQNLPSMIWGFVKDAGHWLLNAGGDLVHGLWQGLVNGVGAVWDFFTSLPGHILGFFKDAGSWLLDVGGALLRGLWQGIVNALGWLWSKITDFIKGLINGIKAGFGISSPSKETAKIGEHLMEGLAQGMADHVHLAVGAAQKAAGAVLDSFGGTATVGVNVRRPLAMSATAAGASGALAVAPGGRGAGTTVINKYIVQAGSVISEHDLTSIMQKVVLQYGQRNVGAGLTVGWNV